MHRQCTVNQSINRPINGPNNRTINQSINRSIDPSVNRTINQSIKLAFDKQHVFTTFRKTKCHGEFNQANYYNSIKNLESLDYIPKIGRKEVFPPRSYQVFGNLHAESTETENQHRRLVHPLHRLIPQDIALATVETVVNLHTRLSGQRARSSAHRGNVLLTMGRKGKDCLPLGWIVSLNFVRTTLTSPFPNLFRVSFPNEIGPIIKR